MVTYNGMQHDFNIASAYMTNDANEEIALPWTAVGTSPHGLRLLLVEDEPSDVFLAEDMLEEGMPDYQWNVVHMPRMANALSIVDHVRFDVALVDLTLLDMDGPDTITVLRTAAPYLPIIVYSGTSNPMLLEKALLNGAHYYIEKGKNSAAEVRTIIKSAMAQPQLPVP